MLVGYVLYRKMHKEHTQADVIQVHVTGLNATGHLVSNATDKDKQVTLHISHFAISRTYKPQIQGTHIAHALWYHIQQ